MVDCFRQMSKIILNELITCEHESTQTRTVLIGLYHILY